MALGLVNTYLKRCVKKGLIKVRQVPSKRYAYYLTPSGFTEKSRLTAEFLSQSLNLFRRAQRDYTHLLDECQAHNRLRVALHGASDLVEIVVLCARDTPVSIVGIVDKGLAGSVCANLPVVGSIEALGAVDAHIVTGLDSPQPVYDALLRTYPGACVLAPEVLEVSTAAAPVVKANQSGAGA